jgi:hypothetical protein
VIILILKSYVFFRNDLVSFCRKNRIIFAKLHLIFKFFLYYSGISHYDFLNLFLKPVDLFHISMLFLLRFSYYAVHFNQLRFQTLNLKNIIENFLIVKIYPLNFVYDHRRPQLFFSYKSLCRIQKYVSRISIHKF